MKDDQANVSQGAVDDGFCKKSEETQENKLLGEETACKSSGKDNGSCVAMKNLQGQQNIVNMSKEKVFCSRRCC